MAEYPVSTPINLEVRIAAGDVEIHAEPRETAIAEVEPYDDGSGSRELAERTRVEFSGDTLLISAPELGGWLLRRSPKLRVTARVPTGSQARIRVASADLHSYGEWSQVKVNSASGDAQLETVTGDLSANTASGDVRAVRVGGRFTVNTASGDVSVLEVSGPVDVKSASGDLRIENAGGDVNIKTASGDATIGATQRGTVRANSVSGDVSIGVVSGTGVWLELNTLSGRTRSDLDMTGSAPPSGQDLALNVNTVSGDIAVHRVTLPTLT
jgi:DUF4097 and DUF4098 domain-containing protein YvlB